NLSTTSTARWMVMIDVKVNATSGYPAILTKGDPLTNGYLLFYDASGGAVGFKINGTQYAHTGMSLATMKNLALSFDGTHITFYVNGVQVAQDTAVSKSVSTTSSLVVGGSGDVTISKLVVTSATNTSGISSVYGALTTPSSNAYHNAVLGLSNLQLWAL